MEMRKINANLSLKQLVKTYIMIGCLNSHLTVIKLKKKKLKIIIINILAVE